MPNNMWPFANDASELIADASGRAVRQAEISSSMLLWAAIDLVLMVWIFSGNTLTILAICWSRKLRSFTSNWFVLALAVSDLLVGVSLPYHLAFYMGSQLGRAHGWCMLRFFLIIVACCVSLWSLMAIACDRYVAIVYPLHYVRFVTRRVAIATMGSGWLVGVTIGATPMVWNNWRTAQECEFDEVLPRWYVVGVVTPLFSAVWLCLLALYVRIWSEASRQAKQMRASICGGLQLQQQRTSHQRSGGDRKSVQVSVSDGDVVQSGCIMTMRCFLVSCSSCCSSSAASRAAGCRTLSSPAPRCSATATLARRPCTRRRSRWPWPTRA